MTARFEGRGHWIVVANRARARVLEEMPEPGVYRDVADLVHPQSRQQGVELAQGTGGGRPGHVEGIGHGTGSAVYQPRTEPRAREYDRFAREVAAVVNAGVAAGACTALTVVASASALGAIKSHLSEGARKHLRRTLRRDCTTLRGPELAARLAQPEAP